jgi:hypothetical protein
VELEIEPEPEEELRRALAAALERGRSEEAAQAGDAWWRAGIEQATGASPPAA